MSKTTSQKSMLDVWNYIGKVIKSPNIYRNGYWGMFYNGKQAFDCVNVIKACAWGVPIGVDITKNKYDYIADNKATMPDVDIKHFYDKATKKGTSLKNIPTDRFCFVYQYDEHPFGHIGIYNPQTKTVREMVGGSIQHAQEVPLANCPYYQRWSNAAYFTESLIASPSVPTDASLSINSYPDYPSGSNKYYRVKDAKGNQLGAYSVWANAYKKWDEDHTRHVYDANMVQLDVTTKTTQTTKTTAASLNDKSYTDYKPNSGKFYYVMAEPNKWVTSKGAFSYWKNAYNCWKANPGLHIYDANWKRLD